MFLRLSKKCCVRGLEAYGWEEKKGGERQKQTGYENFEILFILCNATSDMKGQGSPILCHICSTEKNESNLLRKVCQTVKTF